MEKRRPIRRKRVLDSRLKAVVAQKQYVRRDSRSRCTIVPPSVRSDAAIGRAGSEEETPRTSADVTLRLLLAAAAVGAATLAACPAHAQVFNTGPAGLAQQMPRVHAPYLANISRVKVLGKGVGSPARAQADTTFRAVGPAFVPRKLAAAWSRATGIEESEAQPHRRPKAAA